MCQSCARDSGNKIAASAHGMGSGGSAVDAMVIGCLGVESRAERFLSYLAMYSVVCIQYSVSQKKIKKNKCRVTKKKLKSNLTKKNLRVI